MKAKPTLWQLAIFALVLAWQPSSATASTVWWFSGVPDLLYDSAGQALDGYYSFEIGSFGSFVPTYQNVDQWEANWKVFDRAYDPTPADPNDGDPEGWNADPLFQFFGGNADHDTSGFSSSPDALGFPTPTEVFGQDEVAYLWVYNSKTIEPSSEWALVTNSSNTPNNWRFPDPADTAGSYNWDLADADQVIIGGVNDTQGDGTYTVDPGTFSLQTHVVPEPGSALLVLLTYGTWLSRRRRNPTVNRC
jgi:hypothetical protein